MAKSKNIFFCQECGYESAKWLGQCPACKAWNTFVEEPTIGKGSTASGGIRYQAKASEPVLLSSVHSSDEKRRPTGISEFDRVLGGGIVPGSLVLVGGDPGIGKSTLLLQMSRCLSEQSCRTVYVSGEESLQQIRLRADRLGVFKNDLAMLCETNLDVIQETILKYKPEVVIIDSIQTMYREAISSGAGSVSQVREATSVLMQLAKRENIAIFIVGHVTKEGVVAGPRVLEHMVDTVLYFEGDRHASYRLLRAVKNRFGSTNEIGVFEMCSEGLTEVKNPSEFMLSGRPEGTAGSVVACAMEGTLAVLEKRLGLKLAGCDAYINLAGGMRLNEPAIDLAIVAAVISSYRNAAVESDTMIFGEVGLTGEVRAVSQAEQRVREAEKLGFKVCCIPQSNMKYIRSNTGIRVIGIRNVKDLYDFICTGRVSE